MISLAPLCLSPARCAGALERCHAFLTAPLMQSHQIVAFTQGYRIEAGACSRVGAPALIRGSGGEHEITPCPDLDNPELHGFTAELAKADLPEGLQTAMINVASKDVELIAFPGIIVMQASDLGHELKSIARITSDMSASTWARGALATVIVQPPKSMHEALRQLADVTHALSVLRGTRQSAFFDAERLGLALGEVDFRDLSMALQGA